MHDIAHPGRTRTILERHHLTPKKSLGQNFLVDSNILRNIVQAAEIKAGTGVLEVGPGIGSLTEQLARSADRVLAFEIDGRLLPILEENLAAYPNVHIVHQDILKADLEKEIATYLGHSQTVSIVANLPYYVTTPILVHLLESGLEFRHMVLMIQKEVAGRLTARPGTKAYGSLSVLVQYYSEPAFVHSVSKTVFIPQPKVDSAIVKLTRRATPAVKVEDESFFFRLVRAGFATRRKTLLNNLVHHFLSPEDKPLFLDVLSQAGIDGQRRAETLSLEEFAHLSCILYHKVGSGEAGGHLRTGRKSTP